MLTSDGLTRAQFLPMWRDAMWAAGMEERARLVLELGRVAVRDEGRSSPLVVATTPKGDVPFVLMPLAEAPSVSDVAAREAVRTRLAEVGAAEVFTLLTARGPVTQGVPSFLLAVWGERAVGSSEEAPDGAAEPAEVCWIMPYRWGVRGLEEAEPMAAPDPSTTVFGRELRGLLPRQH